MLTVHGEVVGDVISSRLVRRSTPVDASVVQRRHGDLQVASVERDPDVGVLVEGQARAVAEPGQLRRRNSAHDAVERLRPTGDDDRRQVFVRLVNSCRHSTTTTTTTTT